MTRRAGIRDAVLLGGRGRYESKRMAADIHVADRSGDARHMAIDTLNTLILAVLRVLSQGISARARGRLRPMTRQAK